MDGVILQTDTKWAGFPFYDAQVGTYGQATVEVNPPSGFVEGQAVQFAITAAWGTTPWQNGVVTDIEDGRVFISGTA
ncbi:MAG: hypothetical protein AB7O65_11785 [Candidatus Korobacteraceae bacterium]